jgi:predicted nucleotidyltransferase
MIDLSSSTEPRLAVASQVLAEVGAVAERHGFPLMVVGATARDILSEAIIGGPPGRATADVDVAVAVPSWEAFEAMTSELPRVGRSRHRFSVSGVAVDVVPFGDVETRDRMVDWGDGTRMSALGLSETFAQAERARLPGGTEVLVPTVPGLAVLKLSAWSDRRLATRRDVVDLQTIIGWYATGALLDELYDTEVDLLETYDFDPGLASAFRLGRHMAELLGANASTLAALLDDDGPARLSADMRASASDQVAILQALRDGLRAADRD